MKRKKKACKDAKQENADIKAKCEKEKENTPKGDDLIIEEIVETKNNKDNKPEQEKKQTEAKSPLNETKERRKITERDLKMLKYLRRFYGLNEYSNEQILDALTKTGENPDNVFIYLLN